MTLTQRLRDNKARVGGNELWINYSPTNLVAIVLICWFCLMTNSRCHFVTRLFLHSSSLHLLIAAVSLSTAIVQVLSYLQFEDFELYWGAVFFTTRRGVLEKSFFKSIFGVNFEAGNKTRKKFGVILFLNNMKSEAKREWFFVHIVFF